MKKIIIIFVIGLLTRQFVLAQGEITYLSNLGQPSTGSNPAGSDSWIATEVLTGNNAKGYLLDSVQLAMSDATGSPDDFTVMLYSEGGDSSITPGDDLNTLIGSDNPSVADTYTYTPISNIILSSGTRYFIVLTAGTDISDGAYEWNVTAPSVIRGNESWSAGDFWKSNDGSNWSFNNSGAPQFAITATPIPEPSSLSLIMFGSGILFYVRRNKKHFNP
jgi:hypothetical protein